MFLTAVVAVPDMPLKEVAMLLCYTSGFSCLLTPYASGPSVIYYGSDYIERTDFWPTEGSSHEKSRSVAAY